MVTGAQRVAAGAGLCILAWGIHLEGDATSTPFACPTPVMMKIIAALPAYNEEVAVGSVVLRAGEHVEKVIVVDDGSTDRTKEVAELAGAVVVRHGSNAGYGAAIKSCFQKAKELDADILVILDADGQHDPDEIPHVLQPIYEGVDIVIGSCFITNGNSIPAYRKFWMMVLNSATNAGSKNKVSDSQSGFRAYSKNAIGSLRFRRNGMGTEIFLPQR